MKSSDNFNEYLWECERQYREDLRLEQEAQERFLLTESKSRIKWHPQITNNMSAVGICVELGFPTTSKYITAGQVYTMPEIIEEVMREIKSLPIIGEFRGAGFRKSIALQILKAHEGSVWKRINKVHIFNINHKTIIIP